LLAAALAFAMLFPTLVAWLYFLVLARGGGGQVSHWQQFTYGAGKCVQFAFPVVFLWAFEGRFPRPGRPRFAGLLLGLAFGLAVAALIFGLYFGVLRHSALLDRTPGLIRQKLREFGADSALGYVLLGAFLCVAHSLLEEYYWRWFVFGRLRKLLPLAPSLLLASLAFMAHHVIILHVYLPGRFLSAVLPLSLAVAVGGAVWALLYERTGSVWSPWLSHLLVDAAIFVIGWEMLRQQPAAPARVAPPLLALRAVPDQSSSCSRNSAGSKPLPFLGRSLSRRGRSRPAFSSSDWLMMSSSISSSARRSAGNS
jgi:hypothetical protein